MVSGEATLSAENSGKLLGGRDSAPNPGGGAPSAPQDDLQKAQLMLKNPRDAVTGSGVARILCQGAQVWRREKTENKCMSYRPRQHSLYS